MPHEENKTQALVEKQEVQNTIYAGATVLSTARGEHGRLGDGSLVRLARVEHGRATEATN